MSILKTERLVLRPFKEGDAAAMYKNWTTDERVARYCRWHPHESIEVTQQLLDMYIDDAEYNWAIVLRDTDEPIGAVSVVSANDEEKSAEIGYVLSYSHWGTGYMTEAVKALIEHLFSGGYTVVTAAHHIDNPASGKVMEKCGMVFTHNDKAQAKFGSNELCDVKWYRISK